VERALAVPPFSTAPAHAGRGVGRGATGRAVIRAVLTWQLGTSAMVVVNNVVPYVVIAGLIFFSITVGRRARAQAHTRHGAAAAGPPTTTSGPASRA
jgi:hypothetical protein